MIFFAHTFAAKCLLKNVKCPYVWAKSLREMVKSQIEENIFTLVHRVFRQGIKPDLLCGLHLDLSHLKQLGCS
jgi:hypothetical protein